MGVSIEALAWVAASLLALAAAFQIALAIGVPWGAAAFGGRAVLEDGTLPTRFRFINVIGAVALTGGIWVVLAAGSVIGRGSVSSTVLTVLLWIMAGYFALNTAGNVLGKHPVERWGGGAVAVLLAVLCALLAVRS